MAFQRLEVRGQRLDVRGGGFLEGLEELEELEGLGGLEVLEDLEELDALEELERLEARRRAMTELKRKLNNNDAIRARVRAHYRSFMFFAVTSVTQSL